MKNRNRRNRPAGQTGEGTQNPKEDMKDNKKNKVEQDSVKEANADENLTVTDDFAGEGEDTQAEAEVNTLENQVAQLQTDLEAKSKDYLFLAAEFDNYRKRTLKEKAEIIKNGGENVLKGLLPIVDDFERGLKAAEGDTDSKSVTEGMTLVYHKLIKYMESMGVKEMESTGKDFDSELMEAIARVPTPSEEMKGKVIDTVQKGYMINDKVLRHAKVAVAQ